MRHGFDNTKNDNYYASNSFHEDFQWNVPIEKQITNPLPSNSQDLQNLENQQNAKWIWCLTDAKKCVCISQRSADAGVSKFFQIFEFFHDTDFV